MSGTVLPIDAELRPGTYAGDYVIGDRLGSGTFGTVYEAHHPVIGARAAVKVLHIDAARQPEVISRFVDEARAASRADHPSIIDVFNFGKLADGRRFIVMERLDGEGLDERIAREAPFTVAACVAVLEPIAAALAAAHAAGVTHRDVKPANIFVCAEGPPKLLDFGVAKLRDGGAAGDEPRNASVGTPAYMSPEQCEGGPTTPAADVYALGVVAFEMLAARLPFVSADAREVMNAHIGDRVPRLHRVRPDLSRATGRAVAAMMAKDPAARPGPVEAIAALAATIRPPGGRRRRRAGLVLASAGAVVAAGVMWAMSRPVPEADPIPTSTPVVVRPAAAVAPAEPPTPPPPSPAIEADGPVVFTLVGLPDGAAATLDATPLPMEPGGVLRVPRDRLPTEVELSAPGHRARKVLLEPAARTLDVRLEPLPTAKPRRKKAKDPHDIDPW